MSRQRTWLGRGVLALLPFFLLAASEMAARLARNLCEFPIDVPLGLRFLQRIRVLDEGGEFVRDAAGHYLLSNHPEAGDWRREPSSGRFACTAGKPIGSLRIFCLGESTTFGVGYAPRCSYSRFLEARLSTLLSREDVEVVNTGVSGYDSACLPEVAEDVLLLGPDLLVVYAGHNELKDPNLVRVERPLAFATMRTLTTSGLWWLLGADLPPRERRRPERVTIESLIDAKARDRSLHYFADSLRRIAVMARRRDVPVLFCVPTSNLGAEGPYQSVLERGTETERNARRRRLLELSDRFEHRAIDPPLKDDDRPEFEAALAELDSMLAVDRGIALAHFLRGRLLWRLRRPQEAWEAFQRAAELDRLPIRAAPDHQKVVRRAAAESGTSAVDVDKWFRKQAKDEIPAADLFIDYCHPNLLGHWLIADAILDAIVSLGRIAPRSAFDFGNEPEEAFHFYCEMLEVSEGRSALLRVQNAVNQLNNARAETGEKRDRLLEISEQFADSALQMETRCAQAFLVKGLVAAVRGDRAGARSAFGEVNAIDGSVCAPYADLLSKDPQFSEWLKGVGAVVERHGIVLTEGE